MIPTSMVNASLDMKLVGNERRLTEQFGVICVRFEVINSFQVLFTSPGEDGTPHSWSRCLPSVRAVAVPMAGLENEDMAYQRCFCLLSMIGVVHPAVVNEAAPEIAFMLRLWTQHAILGGLNSMDVEIRLRIEYLERYGTARVEEATSGFDIDEDAALAWGTTESMNDADGMRPLSRGLFGSTSSSSSQVEAFLLSCRPQTWNSKTQCVICLECTGGEEKGKEIISLPCSHLFHGTCIRKWFEVSDACPLCRSTVSV